MEKSLAFLNQNKQKFLDDLVELLKIPSISAQTEHNHDILRAANWLKRHLTEIGLEKAAVLPTKGHPVVYAEYLKHSDKPTILIYGHYDVQSPDPLDQWTSDPFEPQIRAGNIYARGTSDDKGQLLTHIKAIESILKAHGELPVNVKFLIEGEEEVGGSNIDEFVEENKELCNADMCLISDSQSLSPTEPQIEFGLRGIVYSQIELSVMPKDMHSGLYGGNIPNAGIELVNLLAKLKDQNTQRVLIPNFYDNVRSLSEREYEELQHSTFTAETVLEETGVKRIVGMDGLMPIERAGSQPTLDINGMWSGYTGEGPKTIIPAKAGVKISMRIVPNQTTDEIAEKFTEFVKKSIPEYVEVEVKVLSKGEPIIMNIESDYFKKAEKALAQTFGNKPIYELSGASIPVTALFREVLEIDSILMGFGLPDDGLHSPNEKMSLEMFYKGIEASIRFLSDF